MNSAAGGYFDSMRKTSQQTLTDLASAPVWFLASGRHDRGLYLLGQLVGIAERPACPIAEAFQAAFLIAFEDLVASLPGNAELAAQGSHAFPVLKPDHKAHSFVHYRSFLPWHPHFRPPDGEKSVTHVSGTFCYPCLGTVKKRLRRGRTVRFCLQLCGSIALTAQRALSTTSATLYAAMRPVEG